MKRFILLFLLIMVTGVPVQAQVGRDPYQYFFNETWGDYHEELSKAKEQGKKAVLVFFEMDECPFCHRMKESVLNQPEIQAYFRDNFLIFSIDIEGDVEITDFQGQSKSQKTFATVDNKVRATPVFAFFDLEGNTIARYTGATSTIEEFHWLGEFVAEGHYKTMNFTKYKRERRRATDG